MSTEQWKYIEGFKNKYQVSNFGRVRNSRNTLMKFQTHRKGYFCVSFCVNSVKRTKKVHRLVAEAFIENPENKEQVNHIDGNKKNNHVDNLEWNTPLENVRHAMDNNLWIAEEHYAGKGEKNGFHKLKDYEVLEIRSKFKPRVYTREMLAKEYNVSKHCIKDVITRRSWNHL